jgi:hypothetical protein
MNTDAKQTEALFFGWALFRFLKKSPEIRSEIVAAGAFEEARRK